ncbi:hypothetical protein DFH06DRAFT_1325967 [Mycena polygramma]|nr:hypothetical protein DFH06DRAFT_1325967 [Mycena polygramma]
MSLRSSALPIPAVASIPLALSPPLPSTGIAAAIPPPVHLAALPASTVACLTSISLGHVLAIGRPAVISPPSHRMDRYSDSVEMEAKAATRHFDRSQLPDMLWHWRPPQPVAQRRIKPVAWEPPACETRVRDMAVGPPQN